MMTSEDERAAAYREQPRRRVAFRRTVLEPKVKGDAAKAKGLIARTKARAVRRDGA